MISLTIEHAADAGQRLDKFARKYLPNAPLGAIFKMLRTGKIKVGGKKKDQTYKLEVGDIVTFWLTDIEIEEMKRVNIQKTNSQSTSISSGNMFKLEVLYEDNLIMVINKPSGYNVHPGDHKTQELSIIELIQDHFKGKYDSLTFRPSLVHRIDRDTSGCLLIAKDKGALEFLLKDLQSHSMEKVYHAIVTSTPSKKQDTIRAKLLRIENAKNEAKVRVDEAGQNAITHYFVLQSNITSQGFSLLECNIETGRTHQIRVHMAHIGCPILGDKAYGNISINSFVKRSFGIHRQMLHARKITFTHPNNGKKITIEAPYPKDFLQLISV